MYNISEISFKKNIIPFGLEMMVRAQPEAVSDNLFRYNGKELQTDLLSVLRAGESI